MKMLDLFSGIGGFSLAAQWAGFKTIQFVENDVFCQKVLRKNFPDVPIHDDIRTFNFTDEINLLTGGFPCQPFSVAGKKKGVKDDRYLWPEMFRVIRDCRPHWIIAENVSGIIPVLDPILKDLESEDYSWRAFLIPASAIGAPHKRERLWIIANANRIRCTERISGAPRRPLQMDWQWHVAALQEKWAEFQPKSWQAFDFQNWLGFAPNTDSKQCYQRAKDKSTVTERLKRQELTGKAIPLSSTFGWEESEPPIPGVDDGLSDGVDRNKSLGNAIVPQIPYLFMMIIKEITEGFSNE